MYGFESLKDLLDVLLVLAVGGFVALFWPKLQAYYKRRRFENLIARELEEIGPFRKQGEPTFSSWVDHQQKDFVHRRVLENPSQNFDVILSLDPTLVYHVSQLWDALKTGDDSQWLHYLKKLADRFGNNLAGVYREWDELIASYKTHNTATEERPKK